MYSNLLSDLVCREYERVVGGAISRNSKGILIRFSVSENAPSVMNLKGDDWYWRYHAYELLIFGETNYVGVFLRETLLHPDEKTDWYCLACHDSCWKSDGVGRFFDNANGHISGFKSPYGSLLGHPFDAVDISDEEAVSLREAEKARLGHNYKKQVVHPLMEHNTRNCLS